MTDSLTTATALRLLHALRDAELSAKTEGATLTAGNLTVVRAHANKLIELIER